MPDVRFSVSRRRTVVKRKLPVTFVLFYALFEHVVLLPELDYLFLSRNEIERSVYFLIHIASRFAIVRTYILPARLPDI